MSDSKKVGDNFSIIKMIGKGSFGSVFLTRAKDGNYYASKVELRSESSRLIEEYKIYRSLNKRGFKVGLPHIYNLVQTPKFNMMMMELLGPSLDSLLNKYNKKFTLETVLSLGINIVTLLERLHNSGFIHRDIKPNNFLIGYGKKCDRIYMTDLGLSKQYVRNGKHIDYTTNRSLIGTLRYASLNMHMGIEPSRRDDLESVGYMLIYCLKGTLPWQGLKKKHGENQVELIGNTKLVTSVDKLCEGLHENFKKYIQLCRNLKFEEKPNYDALRDCFNEIANELRITPKFQWISDNQYKNFENETTSGSENYSSNDN